MAEPIVWLEVVKVVATLGAAGVAAWVAYSIGSSQRDIARQQAETAAEQKRIAAAKLNLELFEERYALFHKVWSFLSGAALQREWDAAEDGFSDNIPKARLLFGNEIGDYMKEANKKRADHQVINQILKRGGARQEDIQMNVDLGRWFWDEASVNCYKRFAPYLDFSNWKAQ